MWRILLALGLLFGTGIGTISAQDWSGSAALGLSGGHHTNLYLDPVLSTWTPDVESPFWAVTPQLGLTRNARRTRLDVMVRSRLHPHRTDVPQLAQSTIRLRRRLHSDWTLGITGGGTRFRYPALHEGPRTARDSWWVLPSLRWTPTSETMLTLRTGLTQRFEKLPTLTDRQTSGLASLHATHWLSDRLQGRLRLYYSNGRTSTAETGFGGTGGTLSATYWPSNTVSLQGEITAEQFRYERLDPPRTVRNQIRHAGVTIEWTPRSSLTLFGRARALSADLESGDARTDVHVSAGLRLQTRHVFGGSTEESLLQQRVCRGTEDGVRLQVPYDGDGTLHVTGDFNNWSLPGIPLEQTDDATWQTTLDLPPGRYEYRLRVVYENEDDQWVDLPSFARTAEDTFGGTNGVCIVQ